MSSFCSRTHRSGSEPRLGGSEVEDQRRRGVRPDIHDADTSRVSVIRSSSLRWKRRDSQEAQRDLSTWIAKWSGNYPKLVDWVETNIGETLTFYRLPRQHHKHMKSTNMLERLNEEIKRRTRVVRIFPNAESCLRLVRALCAETHEAWLEDNRYLNMSLLAEQKKELLKMAA
jgi:transposase-like protein